ncbi:stage V sporulation protein AF [Caldalkalibacillus thermarum]|uniref:spore germination protein n=1 Tax=Caldalkalibacillus thermarum TaxID=296745 RepID=UPI00166DB562|nr:spore germination protein [Caldalkalibacillus thermarum]GGK15297.1 stage V sporulation protein AF [Caldalkalibacillus thermarum]
MNKQTKKRKIEKSLEKNYEYMDERLDFKLNYDVGCRKYKVGNRQIRVFFVNGLADTANMTQLLRQISFVKKPLTSEGAFKTLFEETLANVQVEVTENMDEAIDQLLSGLMVVMGEGWEKALIVDVRQYPGREPEEPDTERVIRGSRDGFTENIIHNTAMIRRRVRDARLRMEIHQVGERSKTDICIAYIKDIANPRLVEEIRKQLEKIDVDGIPMGEKAIEEFVIKQGYNPFPKVRFTERPDVAAAHLYEGHVMIMVDTSPAIIILPTTYFHHLQHAEEFRQTPFIGLYVRWIRYIGILSALFLLPLYTLFVLEPTLLPDQIKFIGPKKDNYSLPIFLQFIFAELGIDMMRMAAIHTPTPLATAMGLVAAILIGEIAIQVGLFVPEVILYLAVAAIGTFATPSYEVSLANKMIRMVLLVLVTLFKVSGLVIGVTVFIVWLSTMKSLRTPYLWPFIPFNLKAFSTVILRLTSSMTKTRPSIAHPRNKYKQPQG